MKIGIIISNTDPEIVWNALRFANTAVSDKHQVEIFLLGQGVEIENIKNAKFDVQEQLNKYKESNGQLYACGTCIKSRQLQFDVCPISTIEEMLRIVTESDKLLTF
jgi:sulfur relay (sulfurtransferase) complex TusBCD TusD component (DsrE family)